MPLDGGPHDWHNYSWNWVTVCKAKKGGVMDKYPSMSRIHDNSTSSTLMGSTPTQSKRDPCCQLGGGFIPLLHQIRRINTTTALELDDSQGTRACPHKRGMDHKEYPSQKSWTVIDSVVKDIFVIARNTVPKLWTVIDSVVKDIFVKKFMAYVSLIIFFACKPY